MSDFELLRAAQREKRIREGLPLCPTLIFMDQGDDADELLARAAKKGQSIEHVIFVRWVWPSGGGMMKTQEREYSNV